MGKLFDMDGPLLRGLNKLADLMWLNILTIICCLPVFTAGAAITAAHYVELKIHRNEEGYITREFFKSFKMNFKQSTVIGLINIILVAVFATDIYLMRENSSLQLPKVVQVIILAAALMFIFYIVWVFPVQAKFINTITNTMKNAFAISMMKFPITIAMVVLDVCPAIILWYSNFYLFPIILLFGVSVPIYGSAALYSKFFKQLEENILANNAEEEKESREDADEGNTSEGYTDEGNTGEESDTEEDGDSEKIFSDKPLFEEEEH